MLRSLMKSTHLLRCPHPSSLRRTCRKVQGARRTAHEKALEPEDIGANEHIL